MSHKDQNHKNQKDLEVVENKIEENNPGDEALSNEQSESIENQQHAFQSGDEIEKLKAENNKLREIAANIQNQYLSLQSDFKILQNKYQRDVVEGKNQAIAKNSKILLSSMDELEKIVNHGEDNPRKSGLEMVLKGMNSKLENIGVKKIEVKIGDDMNEHIHEPLGSIQAGEKLAGKIAQVYCNAYSIGQGENEIIIQPAKVLIGN